MGTPLCMLLILLLQLTDGHDERALDVDRSGPQEKNPTSPPDWLLQECLRENYTRLSCSKVFCPPWRRCISGKCVCKLPYQCPKLGKPVCGLDKKNYLSYCQAQAVACRTNKPVFSHYGGQNCNEIFEVRLKQHVNSEVVEVKSAKGNTLVCGSKSWNIAAANVVCRHQKEDARGALSIKKVKIGDLGVHLRLPQCMSVKCTGSELSLAECVLYEPQNVENDTEVAAVHCYNKAEKCLEFSCVNQKCIPWKQTCDGIDNCGDNSDEMCCKRCQKGFYCKPGVCIPSRAVQDNIRDCLGGEDEVPGPRPNKANSTAEVMPEKVSAISPVEVKPKEDCPAEVTPEEDSLVDVKPEEDTSNKVKLDREIVWSNPKDDVEETLKQIESQLECGIPNVEYVHRTEEQSRTSRRKRVVGGEEALPTQIQWQVAVQEDGTINCGGVYLGGCWVLTAAHCVRPKPQNFQIKFSLWKKLSKQTTSDISPVKKIIIHKDYNSRTYQNDIALVQLDELNNEKNCINPNPAVRSVCVPWTTLQFQPGDTCTISGWGRNKDGQSASVLKWANVTIIGDCKRYYKERFFEGMECAGDLEGSVDSCQGDSGGPLVCKDASGLSYVWGIVSWGEKCGEVGFPGVYTKVAHYFEWIRHHTGWAAVTKYNH